MAIRNEAELQRAVREVTRLQPAALDSPDGRRRQKLEAEIEAYYARCQEQIEKAKPKG